MQSIGNAIAGFFIALALAIGVFAGFNILSVQSEIARDRLELDRIVSERQAYDACWEAAAVEYSPNSEYDLKKDKSQFIYELCLRDKGLDTTKEKV